MHEPASPTSSTHPPLATDELSVHFGQRSALEDVSIRIDPGRVVALLGPNGAGKSTLLKAMAGMIPPSHGSCTVLGETVRRPSRRISYVPQRADADWTFPISVIDAVLLGLDTPSPRWRRYDIPSRERAIEALRGVRMDDLANVQIGTLSGGQQQRVFLARAILANASAMLLDEPFTGVDSPTQELFVEIIAGLKRDGIAVVVATHDLDHAQRTADDVILLNRNVIAAGPMAETFTAANLRAAFGSRMVVFEASSVPPKVTSP